jgi:hypothetical protein
MADLTNQEKRNLEKMLGMGGGYVLTFSNRTFADFVLDSTGKNIYDESYNSGSGSKANRLRAFWTNEPSHLVGRLLRDLLAHAQEINVQPDSPAVLETCRRTAERLLASGPVVEIEAIAPITDDKDFATLAKSVKESIAANQPEAGLDRLHTFVTKYMRILCERHGLATGRDKPLHSLVGEYIKAIKADGRISSEMTDRILKSSISTLEAFNHVRNDQSLAHDNPVLNYDESLLIFNHVASSIRFIEALERRMAPPQPQENPTRNSDDDDVPF